MKIENKYKAYKISYQLGEWTCYVNCKGWMCIRGNEVRKFNNYPKSLGREDIVKLLTSGENFK